MKAMTVTDEARTNVDVHILRSLRRIEWVVMAFHNSGLFEKAATRVMMAIFKKVMKANLLTAAARHAARAPAMKAMKAMKRAMKAKATAPATAMKAMKK